MLARRLIALAATIGDALDHDQPARAYGKDGVANAHGSGAPVLAGHLASVTPVAAIWLRVRVEASVRRVGRIQYIMLVMTSMRSEG